MKTAAVFCLWAAAAASAHESIQNHLSVGFCRSPSLLSQESFPPLLDSTCSSKEHRHGSTRHSGKKTSSAWTHVGPCESSGDREFCVYSSSTFAGGRGISMVTRADRAERFVASGPFTNPDLVRHINRDLDPTYEPMYQSVKVQGKGVGLVALKTIERGDRIMASTPSVMIDYGAFEHLAPEQVQKLQMSAVDLLPSMHRSLVMNLSTHVETTMTHQQKVDRVLATNSFDIDDHDEDDDAFYVVFPEISRMNHDCRPNADYYYDPDTMSHNIHAVRRINIGEEITLSYIDPMQSHDARVERLNRTWGFPCGCSMCQQRDHVLAESDDRLEQMQELRQEFQDYSPASRATPQMGELMVSLYEQDRLDLMLYEAHTYAAIEWNGVGEPWLATKHARLAVEYGLPSVGPRGDVVEMQALIRDPFKHWSWMLRTRKRMSWGKKRGESEE